MLIFPYSRNNIIRYSGDCIVTFVALMEKETEYAVFSAIACSVYIFVVKGKFVGRAYTLKRKCIMSPSWTM